MESFKLNLMGKWDVVLSNREQTGTADLLGTNRETWMKYLKGIRVCSSKNVTGSIAHLKCLYTKARSMGYKQKLEAIVQLKSYNVITVTEIWWDESHD